MAILKIARMGHPILRRRATEVVDPTTAEIARLVADMHDTLADADGVGLAAPQVHVSLRLVLFQVPVSRGGADEAVVLINPQITPLDDDTLPAFEACLSIPGLTGVVPRYRRIGYAGVDLRGHRFEREAEGFHARVVQHECDHLDGILYPARMTDLASFGFAEEMRRPDEDD